MSLFLSFFENRSPKVCALKKMLLSLRCIFQVYVNIQRTDFCCKDTKYVENYHHFCRNSCILFCFFSNWNDNFKKKNISEDTCKSEQGFAR